MLKQTPVPGGFLLSVAKNVVCCHILVFFVWWNQHFHEIHWLHRILTEKTFPVCESNPFFQYIRTAYIIMAPSSFSRPYESLIGSTSFRRRGKTNNFICTPYCFFQELLYVNKIITLRLYFNEIYSSFLQCWRFLESFHYPKYDGCSLNTLGKSNM